MKIDKAKPFLKWAGGKRGLIETYEKEGFFPEDFNRYFEPMLGGGAVFFHIAQNYNPNEFILSDVNSDLICAYEVIRNEPNKLIDKLKEIKEKYKSKNDEAQAEFYYECRDEFNKEKLSENEDLVRKTALFIFLNKTCYNGLYRVNQNGEFNVPYGKYKNPGIFSEKNIRNVSKLLQKARLLKEDFEKVFKKIEPREKDFVYFDPPYIPLTDTADFTSYSEGGFDHKEQKRLANLVDKLAHRKGCYVMESNSGSPITKKLYHQFENLDVYTVKANRYISCKGEERGPVEEIVIIGNYEPSPRFWQKTLPIQE